MDLHILYGNADERAYILSMDGLDCRRRGLLNRISRIFPQYSRISLGFLGAACHVHLRGELMLRVRLCSSPDRGQGRGQGALWGSGGQWGQWEAVGGSGGQWEAVGGSGRQWGPGPGPGSILVSARTLDYWTRIL